MVLTKVLTNAISGNQEVANDGPDTEQTSEQIEMAKLFRYFANVKTKAHTSVVEKKAAEASLTVIMTEQLPPPRRFLRRTRSLSSIPNGPAPAKLSTCALGAQVHSNCEDAVDAARQSTNYDTILEYLMEPTAAP